jgi:hypothetical protein
MSLVIAGVERQVMRDIRFIVVALGTVGAVGTVGVDLWRRKPRLGSRVVNAVVNPGMIRRSSRLREVVSAAPSGEKGVVALALGGCPSSHDGLCHGGI